MKIFIIVILSINLFAKGLSNERLKLSKHMLEVMNKNGYMDLLVKQVIREEIAQNPLLYLNRNKAVKFAYKYASFKSLKGDLAKVYARELNSEELKVFTKFCQTSAGQKILLKIPRLINISSYIAQKRIQAHYKELVNEMMK